jgi:hypothetical protein
MLATDPRQDQRLGCGEAEVKEALLLSSSFSDERTAVSSHPAATNRMHPVDLEVKDRNVS